MNAELASWLPVSRRDFLVTSLAVGFALAVQPVGAATITTDTKGLVAGEIKIPVADGEIPAYQAMPAQGGAFPVVLVVQEIFGVHEHIKDVCRRFAKLGYLAIAPELYARQGDVSKLQDFQEILKIVGKVPDNQVMLDLDRTVEYAAKSGKGDVNKLGITGFCWGGRIVWLYAAHNPKVKAGAAWYGRLVGKPNELQTQYPIDIAPTLKVPVLGLYGGKDDGIPVATVEQMQEALKKAGNSSQILVYPDAPHGFHADYRPSYREKEATEAWKRLQDWFKKNGVA
ncbi:dienelactone hydrolase family protein [Anthocerotibacter panamensis]|uniref:dienelactone hydrolase family protein n=1 Tax=Anthocerotibacter panamensis TaxID=2857077 RepID=UPI001C406FAB